MISNTSSKNISLLLLVSIPFLCSSRTTTRVYLPPVSPVSILTTSFFIFLYVNKILNFHVKQGTSRSLVLHNYGPLNTPHNTTRRAYIQAALHADEIPGLLVANHLIKLLDKAEEKGELLHRITIVPFANPIGLSQQLLESHSN